MHNVFTRLRMLRIGEQLTQMQLADSLGVSRKTINALELGKCQPSFSLAQKCAKYFGLTAEQIFSSS